MVAQEFHALGFHIVATKNTAAFLQDHGVPAEPIRKLHEGNAIGSDDRRRLRALQLPAWA